MGLLELTTVSGRPSEQERVELWHVAGYTWPPTWQNETEAFKLAMAHREEELMLLPGADERWENYMQYTQSRMVPRFTALGFELIDTPPSVQAKLKAALDRAVLNFDSLPDEPRIDALYTPIPSKFVFLNGIDRQIHEELRPLHEEWSGLQLVPTSAYGLRLNRNGSSLVMHYDKVRMYSPVLHWMYILFFIIYIECNVLACCILLLHTYLYPILHSPVPTHMSPVCLYD
ncbi:hypothetical protein EON64_14120 [archaeon]|nr:MAG: hypothetical protein EON64_14120 [archaeon]